ncbi:outer membrane protein [Labrys wisconsinensis]|uniref:Outer membrane immunogenic protein n=1 Tax=Labrys wisconsinensis TaxID=425677 RepID=A0ABU0JFP1_9HYPH|nr:outer membrane protein [Labrys wisconsinensis]MDQ0473103.1 outer membrane immunogenic protein [Labrys wisconsinensis]
MRTLSCALFAAVLATPAMAADVPQAVEPLAPVPVTLPFSWTGFYVGVNAGAAIDGSDVSNRLGGSFLTSPDAAAYQRQYPGSLGSGSTGFTGGGLLGYNWQFSNFVLGGEADINYAGIDSSSSRAFALTAPFVGNESQRYGLRSDWFGTVRARAGFAWDSLLIYGTGGLAYGDVRASARQTETQGGVTTFDWSGASSDTKVGWTAGAGIEYALDDNWIIGAEYLHVDLGRSRFAMPDAGGSAFTMTGRADAKFDVVRATVKYKF